MIAPAAHPALSMAAQIALAAANATGERVELVRARLGAPRNRLEASSIPLRRALMALLADGNEHAIAQLRPRLPAGVAQSHDASRNQLYLLEQWGWVSSRCLASRRGLAVGNGRSRLYRITPAGRTALDDAAVTPPSQPTAHGDH
jgi:hypothetical protein